MPANGETYEKAVLSRENLGAAWESVRAKKGSPGLDGITIDRWARNWEANIERIISQVTSGTYHPTRPKRFTTIQNNGKIRELSLLTVTDKVLQRAFLTVIEPEFEERFLDCSHAYRKNRSTATAIQQLLTCRDKGLHYVLDADLLDCFNNIDHAILVNLFARVNKDRFVLTLLGKWLLAGRKKSRLATGIPQGAVISPLLCNIYLHQLDAFMNSSGWHYIRYADDFVLLTRTYKEAETGKIAIQSLLDTLKLRYHPGKTIITSFKDGFTFLGVDFWDDYYGYFWQNQRVEVRGSKLQVLYKHIPDFYRIE